MKKGILLGIGLLSSFPVFANEHASSLKLTNHPLAFLCLFIFLLAYLAVMAEEKLKLSKSKPVLLAAGIIWAIIAVIAKIEGIHTTVIHQAIERNLCEYAAIFLFLLVAMTYVNTLAERNVFLALRSWLVNKGFTLRQLFWITGFLSFIISPIADNMTTALLMGAVIMAIGEGNPKFIVIAMVNIVVASNAGGAFSPFGDITTLMVWQSGKVSFFEFFNLFLPSLVNFIVPAIIMNFFIANNVPKSANTTVKIKSGGLVVCFLFLITIMLAVSFEQLLGLPAFAGMLTGMSLLMFFTYFLQCHDKRHPEDISLDIFSRIALAEWDTLLFFLGVMLSVGGLASLGYLTLVSGLMYEVWGPTNANITAGLISSVVDNIPVMFSIIHMNPSMDTFQWLLITLTAGVGGSLLSIGSAAGVALMGASRGMYTFMGHLKWSAFILLGYVLSIATHFLLR